MRYNRLHNSKKQPSDKQKGLGTPFFTSILDCFAYCFAQWGLADLCKPPSTFWSVTLQPLAAHLPTIHHIKGDIHSFHLRHINLICNKRLQSYGVHKRLAFICLVWSIWLLQLLISRPSILHLQSLMRLQDLGEGAPPRALEQVDGEVLSQGSANDAPMIRRQFSFSYFVARAIQGSAKMCSPGCANAAGKSRQKW